MRSSSLDPFVTASQSLENDVLSWVHSTYSLRKAEEECRLLESDLATLKRNSLFRPRKQFKLRHLKRQLQQRRTNQLDIAEFIVQIRLDSKHKLDQTE